MEGIAEIGGSHLALVDILAITLVDDDTVADLHDASLDALQLVAGTCQLDEQEEIDHRMAGGLALSDTYSLDEYLVEACGLAEDDGLTRLAGHTAQRTCRRTRTDERIGMDGELLHARLITQDRTLRTLRRRVDGQHSQTATLLLQHMDTKLVDAGRLARTGHAADAHADRIAAIGQALVDDLLGLLLMVGVDTLDQRDSLREDGDIALDDALDHLGS